MAGERAAQEDREHLRRRCGNYAAALLAAVESGRIALRPGTVRQVAVYHDSWCALYQGRACNCEPVIRTEPEATAGASRN